MNFNWRIFICLKLIKLSLQQICPFDFNLGYSSTNCQGTSTENVILGGELFYFKDQDQFASLMVDYGSSGLFGVWNLTDASLLYSTTFYQDQNIEFHSIFVDKQVNIFDPTISQTYIYIVDQNLNVYQQSLYQEQGKLILQGSSMVKNFPLSTKICYNIKNNIMFYSQNTYVYKRKNNQDFQIEIDSNGIQCESDFNQEFVFVLSSKSFIYMINQNSFQIKKKFQFNQGLISYLQFDQNFGLSFLSNDKNNYSIQLLDSNLNNHNLLFSSSNQINDYGFLKNETLIVCGDNSLIYFGNYSVNTLTSGIDTTDYDYKNIQPGLNLSQLNYTNLVIGDDFTVFYGSQSIITVVMNKNLVVQLHKYLGTSLLVGFIPKAVIDGSLLKTLSSSGLLFLEISNGQLKQHTSCFRALSVYEEKIVGLYFDDELLRIYALENQGKLGYFGYPKGEYLTQYYNLSQNSAWTYNKKADQIYIWGTGGPSNFVVITSYLNGTYLGKLQFDDSFTVNNVYYDNNLEIIIVLDPTQSIYAFEQQNFVQVYKQPIDNSLIYIFQSKLGVIIVFQSMIQILTKGQANQYLSIKNLNQKGFVFDQTYFDSISNSFIMAKVDKTVQIVSIDSQLNVISVDLPIQLQTNQKIQNICYGDMYLIILMNSPNQIVMINKQTNKQNIINNLTIIPNQCLLLLNEELLLVVSNISDLLFINAPSLSILKNEVLDELSSVSLIEIDQQENLLIILLSSSKIISYDYVSLNQVCDWTAINAITVSTFQINTTYKMIVYGSGLLIYFTDYSQKKKITEIQLAEGAQGGVVDLQTNSYFVFTNKVYQFDLQTNNLIQVSTFQHDDIISQLTIVYEWNIIITSSFDNTIAIWSYPELQFKQRLIHDPVDCVKVNNFQVELERNRLFSGCEYGSVYIWKKDNLNNTFYLGNDLQYILTNWNVTQIIVDYQNDYLFLIGWYWYPLIIQLSTVEQQVNVIAMLKGINGVYDILNQCIVLSDQDGNVWNYNITSRNYIFNKLNSIHQGWVNQIVIDPVNQMFASMGDDCTIQIWPYSSDQSQIPYFLYKNTAKILSGQLDLILSFSKDKTVKFWEYEFGIEQKYFQIIQRATSIMSYAYDELENTIYYARSEGNVQKWSIMSEQTENGFNLQYNDRYNSTIFLINKDVFILATTKQLKLIIKQTLQVLQSIQVECSHSIITLDIIICGYNTQLTSFQLTKASNNNYGYQLKQLYQQNLNTPLYKLQNGFESSTEFIIVLVNYSISFIESSTGIVTKSFPLIHKQVIVELIIFNQQVIFSYSFDGQLAQYQIGQTDVIVYRKIQFDYPILQVVVNSDYILVNLKKYNFCQIFKNDSQNIFTLISLIQTASRWQLNQQIILSPENQIILVSSDFYYILFDYKTFKQLYFFQSNILVEETFMKRKVILINQNQLFIQQGQSFIVIASSDPSQKNMNVVQKILNRNSFYENINIKVDQINDYYVVTALSFNFQGFNYLMTDTYGQMSCQQDLQDANFFDIYKRVRDYLNLRNSLYSDYNFQMSHLFNITMSKSFTFYGFPQINSNSQMLVQLTIKGANQNQQILGDFYLNQLLSSQNLVSIQLNNLVIELKEEDNNQNIVNTNLIQVEFISSEIIFNNQPFNLNNLQLFHMQNITIQKQNISFDQKLFVITNTKSVIIEDCSFIQNILNTPSFFNFNNTITNNETSSFTFSRNQILNNKLNQSSIFLLEFINNVLFNDNQIGDNFSDQTSFLIQSFIVTQIIIQNIQFNNNINLVIINNQKNLIQFQNSLMFIIVVQNNYFELSKSIIKQNKYLDLDSYMIYSNSTQIVVQDTQITKEVSNSMNSLITLISQDLLLQLLHVQDCQQQIQSLFTINQSKVQISQSSFVQNSLFSPSLGGGVFYLISSFVNISSSTFSKNQAQSNFNYFYFNQYNFLHIDGGSLYFIEQSDGLLYNVTFISNIAKENGGVLLLNNSDIQIQKCIFQLNKALIGGVLRYLTFKPKFLYKDFNNTVLDSCGTIFQNSCLQNQGQFYGNNFCSYPQSVKINNQTIQNNQVYTFYNVQSGTQSQILNIQLYDEEGNLVRFQNIDSVPSNIIQEFYYYQVGLYELLQVQQIQDVSQRNLKLDGTTLKQFQTDRFLLNQYSVSGLLGKKGEAVLYFYGFQLLSNQSQRFTDSLAIYINYMFRQCQIGEIIQPACTSCSLVNCYTCQNGTYSLQDPTQNQNNLQCKPCDYQSCNYCEGNKISIKKGFWRLNQQDDNILPCGKSKDLCNGQEDTNYCSEGQLFYQFLLQSLFKSYTIQIKRQIGPLCQTCDYLGQFWNSSYALNNLGNQCFKCDSESQQIASQFILSIITLFYLTYIFYETKVNLNLMAKTLILDRLGLIRLGTSAQIGEKSFYSRIMIRYLQIFISISSLSPHSIFNIQITSIFSPVSSNQNLVDCLLGKFSKTVPVYYYKVLFFVAIPLMIIPLGFLFYNFVIFILSYFIRQTKTSFNYEYKKDASIICFIFLFFFLQQSSFESLVQPFTCKQIGSQYLISYYLLEKCYSSDHIILIVAVILPAVFLWIILIPAILMWKIWSKSQQKDNFSQEFYLTKKYGFLFYGYKRNFYLWEFLSMNLRLILVFLVQYFDEDILSRASLMLIFLYLYLVLLQKYKKDVKVSLLLSLKTQENYFKDQSPESSSLRKTLLQNRSPKNCLQTQNFTQFYLKENSPSRYSIYKNQKESIQTQENKNNNINFSTLNSLHSRKLGRKISQKFIQMQQLSIESYTESDKIQNQDQYYFNTKTNSKNISQINHKEIIQLNKNDMELESIYSNLRYIQRQQIVLTNNQDEISEKDSIFQLNE
ncbi:hypothetical protein ABPG73_000216 [Tetrahymena malaccensis]